MATTNAGAFNVARVGAVLSNDGSMQITLVYTNATTGTLVCSRTLLIPADATKPIIDQMGNIVSATVPTALASAISSCNTQLDTSISNGAAANKLNL